MTDSELLVRFLQALGPATTEVVLVGGWAHRLMALHPAAHSRAQPLATKDVDVLFRVRRTAVDLSRRLSDAGFVARPKPGDERPPVADYVHSAHTGAPIEFLIAEVPSRKLPSPTVDVGGVSATALKGLELLLVDPWTVDLSELAGFPAATAMQVQIPNPVSYVLHKLLVSTQRRDRSKREKDLLYAYDTLVLFAASEDTLRATARSVRKSLPKSSRAKLLRGVPHLEAIGDTVRGAAEIARQSGRAAPALAEQIGSTLAAAIRRYLAA